ncbi:MAG TPA: hypothetical protein VF302_04985, partial [Candidatus Limnocylindrales bacterium]
RRQDRGWLPVPAEASRAVRRLPEAIVRGCLRPEGDWRPGATDFALVGSIDALSIAPGSMSGRRSARRRRADGHRDDDEDAEDPQKKAERLEFVSPARPAPDKDPRAACEV